MNWNSFKLMIQQIDQSIEKFVRATIDEVDKTYQRD